MHCVKTVTQALAVVKGVEGTPKVTLDPGAAQVAGNPSADELIAAVKDAGYQADLKG